MNKGGSTILTGIKPTGHPHLGNYVGMIRPMLEMFSQNDKGRNYAFIANYHALNSMSDTEELRRYTFEIAACLIAFGLNHDKVSFYRQSDIPEVFELAAILASVTPKGLMNRAHAYKAKVDDNSSKSKADKDDGVNMGLFTYPILMAADILLFDADIIPVGKDQIQHVEFARDIAGYFNRKYNNEFFNLPQYKVQPNLEALPGLDGRKMSKSYGNTIPIFENMDSARKNIYKIVTDNQPPAASKDASRSTIYQIYAAIAEKGESEELKNRFEIGGLGYGEAKKILADKFESIFIEPAKKYRDLMSDTNLLERVMRDASYMARERASEKLFRLRKLIGI